MVTVVIFHSNKLHMQETVAEAFVRCFQLTPDEVATIKGSTRESPITPEFFTILDKTQKIRSNTKYLLQTGHQNTALDVVEQMNVCREAGLERLYRWCQGQCCSPDPSPLLTQALAALQERPVLFNLVVEEWVVVEDLEEHHDPYSCRHMTPPLHYVGDMLAWVHQPLPSEREPRGSEQRIELPGDTGTTFWSGIAPWESLLTEVVTHTGADDATIKNKAVSHPRPSRCGFLAAPDHLMLPHTRLLLSSSSFRRSLQQRTAEAVCTVYKQLHDIVHNPTHGYTDPSSLLPSDPETVK
ncbi:hypothetical protein O3P69_008322 [Scylla paramamosain]|uniref:Conserved Oligomeric Golgi complex subunit 6 C-terminal domain-containing protein n=1 Tax=Scylla paramamosain TaxID=85552 RepID=A0AAW0SJX1_SCYPA